MKESPPQWLADQWNRLYPLDTKVRYWTIAGRGDGEDTATRSTACVMGGHTAVVKLHGINGFVDLRHCWALV